MSNESFSDPEEAMLTTEDNPFNPFTQWDEWLAYDSSKGYYTPSYLARVAIFSDELSEKDQSLAITQAIDSILKTNVLGNYIKVTPSFFDAKENKKSE